MDFNIPTRWRRTSNIQHTYIEINSIVLLVFVQAGLSEEDDGFQSASSSLSEDKSKLALVPIDDFDYWSHALKQAENKYFTWEQRGR